MLEALTILMMVLSLAGSIAAVVPLENLRMKAQKMLEIDADLKRRALRQALAWGIRSGVFFSIAVFLLPWTLPDTPPPSLGTVLVAAMLAVMPGAAVALFLWGSAHLSAWWLEKVWLPTWRQREARKTPLPEEKPRADVQDHIDWT